MLRVIERRGERLRFAGGWVTEMSTGGKTRVSGLSINTPSNVRHICTLKNLLTYLQLDLCGTGPCAHSPGTVREPVETHAYTRNPRQCQNPSKS